MPQLRSGVRRRRAAAPVTTNKQSEPPPPKKNVAARGRPRTRLAAKKKSEPLIELLEPDTYVEPPKENVVV
ncbi:hypothetical protein A2U01_0071649, partial [Trifolium medium]|nr:hypothetical protein [Trifolium medium]